MDLAANQVRNGKAIAWTTSLINFEVRMFFLRRRQLNNNLQLKILLAGTEAESDDFSARISMMGNNSNGQT